MPGTHLDQPSHHQPQAQRGNVAWTRSTIIDYLKQAGLEDAVAQELSKQFLNGKGEVDYIANDAQKRWSSTAPWPKRWARWPKILQCDGQIQAQDLVLTASATRRPPAQPQRPGPILRQRLALVQHRAATSYINNITINGVVGDWGMVRDTPHRCGQRTDGVDLLRALAQARGAAIQ